MMVDLINLSKSVEQWASSPACTELEAVVCDWAARLLGLEANFQNEHGIGGGVIQVSIVAKLLGTRLCLRLF